jgi:uncharacterized membrane protein
MVPRPVGAMPIWNLLWVVFAAPAAVAAGLAYCFRRLGQSPKSTSDPDPESWAQTIRVLGQIASVVALFLVWLMITAQVRQSFVGSVLPGARPEQNEWYAYSAAWILLAIALLTIGVSTRSSALRWGSLVLMLLSVCKVFLFDTRQLGDLWRVASYLGLGMSLMLVAFVYQRFVFRTARGAVGELP